MNRKTISLISVIVVLAAGAGLMILLSSNKAEASLTEDEARIRTVRTETLAPGEQTVWLEADGFLRARRHLDLVLPVSGKVQFALEGLKGGVRVEEGDLLLALDDRRARLAFDAARTDLIQSVNQFLSVAGLSEEERPYWDRYLARLEKGSPESLPPLPESDPRISRLAATKGVTAGAYALEGAALDLADQTLSAPFRGVLTGDGVTEGSWVSPGVALAGLVEAQQLELSLSLPEEDLLHILPGNRALITRPEDDSSLDGRVERVEPLLNSGSQTAKIHISLTVPEGENWMPGSFVSARIEGRRYESACRVPRELLLGDRLPVYEDGKLAFRPVDIWAFDGNDVIFAPVFPPVRNMSPRSFKIPWRECYSRGRRSNEKDYRILYLTGNGDELDYIDCHGRRCFRLHPAEAEGLAPDELRLYHP